MDNPDSAFQEFASYISKMSAEEEVEEVEDKKEEKGKSSGEKDKEKGKLTSKETKSEGSVNWRHYRFYLRSMTVWKFVVVCVVFLVSEAFKVGGNLVLADWTENFSAASNWSYIGYYCLLAIACSAAGMSSQMGCQFRAAEASRYKEWDNTIFVNIFLLDFNIFYPQKNPPLFAGDDHARAHDVLRDDTDREDPEQVLLGPGHDRRQDPAAAEELPELPHHDPRHLRGDHGRHSLLPGPRPPHRRLLRLPTGLCCTVLHCAVLFCTELMTEL